MSAATDPIARDAGSRHRRYREEDIDTLQALAWLRAMGVGIEDMRTYQANRELGHAARADTDAEAKANLQVQKKLPQLEEVVLR